MRQQSGLQLPTRKLPVNNHQRIELGDHFFRYPLKLTEEKGNRRRFEAGRYRRRLV